MKLSFHKDNSRTVVKSDIGLSLTCHGCPVDAEYAARKLGVMTKQQKLIGPFYKAVGLIDTCLTMAANRQALKVAFGQIEDAGWDTAKLSDLDVAVMDTLARQWLSEEAYDVVDPFNPDDRSSKLINVQSMEHMFGGYDEL